ncbi:MAG TPA: hypothetical protein PKE31_00390 [Pseudomonadota bacterium]|nr:hypothetical protein [Pseudomonadota bacterium]
MTHRLTRRMLFFLGLFAPCNMGEPPAHAEGIHTTYLWHLEQPIYWPAKNASGLRYQNAWESIQAKRAGAKHPKDNLEEIFGKDDRVAIYQWRAKDSLSSMLPFPEAGAQLTYAGVLVENISALGAANQLGYSPAWNQALRQTRSQKTSGGKQRLDFLQFSFHHGLLPLLDPEVAKVELLLHQRIFPDAFSDNNLSKGLFPPEMAFSEHLIPVLKAANIDWVVVSNAHLSRACADYPYVAGSGGDNLPPPNFADVQNPAQKNYNRISIDRGVSPANAVPFSYVPHYARYVNPETGEANRVVVVPAAMGESWKDGYACFSPDQLDPLGPFADPKKPPLVVMAHDGDNAFGGGYSYYMECVPNFVKAAVTKGYVPTTVAQYLSDHPVDDKDVVHVESGAWLNADGDFGSTQFLNWNWPLVNKSGQVDIPAGFAADERGWAVIVAATNYVRTATAVAGMPDLSLVLYPERGGTDVSRAWHFLLGALDSGFMYYGEILDMMLKPVVACNEAVEQAKKVLQKPDAKDTVGPTIFLPQRYPDNPGGLNFGPLYRYQKVQAPPDFWVWTFAHDVSGIREARLLIRVDADGTNPLSDDANETFSGGIGVSAWRTVALQKRVFPKDHPFGDPNFDTSILPTVIADEYFVQVTGYQNVLLDYFVEATDEKGNVSRSPIQHVVVGDPKGTPVVPNDTTFPDGGTDTADLGVGDASQQPPNPPGEESPGCHCNTVQTHASFPKGIAFGGLCFGGLWAVWGSRRIRRRKHGM